MKKIISAIGSLCICSMLIACASPQTELTENSSQQANSETQIESSIDAVAVNQTDYERILVQSEATWAIDVNDTKVVYDYYDVMLRVKVKEAEKASFDIDGYSLPISYYTVEVVDTLKGEKVTDTIRIGDTSGGIVLYEEYLSTLDDATKEKMGITDVSREELAEKVGLMGEEFYALEEGEEYYICLISAQDDKEANADFYIGCGGYAVFEEKDGSFVNVLTGSKLLL